MVRASSGCRNTSSRRVYHKVLLGKFHLCDSNPLVGKGGQEQREFFPIKKVYVGLVTEDVCRVVLDRKTSFLVSSF